MQRIKKYYFGKIKTFLTVLFYGTLPAVNKYRGIVQAGNGKHYCINYQAGNILEIDTLNNTYSTFGVVTKQNHGGSLAPNGKIYCAPDNGTSVLEIDPIAKTVSTFGTLPFSDTYFGTVLAEDGNIYCIPDGANNVLEINPTSRTISTFGSITPGSNKYRTGSLAPNGKIYCAPYNGTSVLEIDPIAKTVSTFGTLPVNNSKYLSCNLALNGNIYCLPSYGETRVLEINPTSKTIAFYGSTSVYSNSSVLGRNGKIYGIGVNNNKILEFDTVTKTLKILSVKNYTSSYSTVGGAISSNGDFIYSPYTATNILEISTSLTNDLLGSDALMPVSLASLPTSNFNKFYNKF